MGAAHSRTSRDEGNNRRSTDTNPSRPTSMLPQRRTRDEVDDEPTDTEPERHRRRRLSLGWRGFRRDRERSSDSSASSGVPHRFRPGWGRTMSMQGIPTLATVSQAGDDTPTTSIAAPAAVPSTLPTIPSPANETGSEAPEVILVDPPTSSTYSPPTANGTTPIPTPRPTQTSATPPDPLARERQEAVRLIESVLGPRMSQAPSQGRHPGLDPSSLAGTFGARRSFGLPRRIGSVPRPGMGPMLGPGRPSTSLGTLLSEVLGASREGMPPGAAPLSGTSVIVQGALVARTAPSSASDGSAPSSADTNPTPQPPPSMPGSAMPGTDPNVPHVATLEEQGEMLSRILSIAAAATAASVVNASPVHPAAAAAAAAASGVPTTPHAASATPAAPASETQAPPPSTPSQPTPSSSTSSSPRHGRELLERLFSGRTQTHTHHATNEPESETISTITRLMRDALRASLPGHTPSTPPHPNPAASSANSLSILSTLERARQGQPFPEGEPGSFDRFLHNMMEDLGYAIQHMNGSSHESESTLPDDVRVRREGDVDGEQLSFFRLFRFDQQPDTNLIPCVLVGVRSLRAEERLMGGDDALPRDGDQNRPGVSRFVLFVSGGRYHEQHPLLVARPRDAGRDLMFMMELLGAMTAMSNKRPTASAADIERSGLLKVRASELPALKEAGRVTENTSEKCLVCLDEWQDDDECRILSCKHAFHAACVDQWLEHNSNSCPLCRSEAVQHANA
ncbi:fog: e3 ubiquitin ligase [Malassezia pachydermatis]|uniref:Fog: e3 ubiquitin ligase n=1 Tax=Malassezia pachydermatis TaxID=77020 RepID=A0A0M9VQE1_9BASI|nr:fog: e3 ubiquitin ligase [Malassezia pachydermatis]KOS15435.1 fog: e3 ubiquitin ligase [Malassezia pachydermatis]